MHRYESIYVDGAWQRPHGEATIEVVEAATEQTLATIPACTAADADTAVESASAAAQRWSAMPAVERCALVAKIGAGLTARADELATAISREVGMPLRLSNKIQVGLPVAAWEAFAGLGADIEAPEWIGNSLVTREPVGVVACITPWNYPLHQITAKVAAALVAGCTVVLKPSEVAPISAFILAEVIHEVGLPAGVFNLVTGHGPVVGEALVRHPGTAMVSFTGSTTAGKRVASLAALGVKRVALELGGKSPAVLLEDADLPLAVRATVGSCFLNSGQTCSALTRLLVPRRLHDDVASLAVEAAAAFRPGSPLDGSTKLGPLASAAQRDRVREHIQRGIADGARLLAGGSEPPEGLVAGFFVQPTVFGDVSPDAAIAQEEIFGPVLSIIPYDDEEDAIRIANAVPYGLAAAVWSGDEARARGVASRIRAGQVDINGAPFNLLAPFGGYKQSGIGRENGRFGLEEFQEIKSIQVNRKDDAAA